ncbi:hypothetical protein N0V94_007214 [Neodidymelliopsis sp. IMI 364377]|nr:hypothetical protein N0V94_007214 [Neodidymelliopsis sp. IMI 364377]
MRKSMAKLFSKKSATKNAALVAKETSTVRTTDVVVGLLGLPAEIRVLVYRQLILEVSIEHSAGLEPFDEDSERPSLSSSAESDWIETPIYHTAFTGQTTKTSSKRKILNLRLAHRLIKQELDHEIIASTTSQIRYFANTLTYPLGYSSSLQDTPLDPFWTTRPLLTFTVPPKSFTQIQHLHLTTYVSDAHITGPLGNRELNFLNTLPPFVRYLTLTITVPDHVSAASFSTARSVAHEGTVALVLHVFRAMCQRAILKVSEEYNIASAGGVVEVQFVFPPEYDSVDGHTWEYCDRAGMMCGVGLQVVHMAKGRVVGIVFGPFSGEERRNRLVKVRDAVKGVWAKVKRWVRR